MRTTVASVHPAFMPRIFPEGDVAQKQPRTAPAGTAAVVTRPVASAIAVPRLTKRAWPSLNTTTRSVTRASSVGARFASGPAAVAGAEGAVGAGPGVGSSARAR